MNPCWWRGLVAMTTLCLLSGCEQREAPQPYQVFSGTVRAIDVETGEVFIRPDTTPDGWQAGRNVPCVATKDSEVYVNDRFSPLRELRTGDTIELAGYRGKDARFIITMAHVTRSQPPPAPPPEAVPSTKTSEQTP